MASPTLHPQVEGSALHITSPALHSQHFISQDAVWPSILFQTDAQLAPGQELTWQWSIQWLTFSKQGVLTTTSNAWDATGVLQSLGGTLTVQVMGPDGSKASISVLLLGTQPDPGDVRSYVSTKPDGSGFDKILNHETRLEQFDQTGHPIKSFDNGYGIAQLTRPAPTYEQAWNWKLNIDTALELYRTKRTTATAYLSQSGRTYTDDQLLRETVSRWNGGPYHVFHQNTGWVRNPNVLCDSLTGNIGGISAMPTTKERPKRNFMPVTSRLTIALQQPTPPGGTLEFVMRIASSTPKRALLFLLCLNTLCAAPRTIALPGQGVISANAGPHGPWLNIQGLPHVGKALLLPVDNTIRPGSVPALTLIGGERSGRAYSRRHVLLASRRSFQLPGW